MVKNTQVYEGSGPGIRGPVVLVISPHAGQAASEITLARSLAAAGLTVAEQVRVGDLDEHRLQGCLNEAADDTADSRHTLERVCQEKHHQRYLYAVQGIELHGAPELFAAKPPPDTPRQPNSPLIVRGSCRIDLRKSQQSARVSKDGSRPGADDK